eukprot:3642153-Heterocapsa_arctica.AAC.1
MMLGVMKAKTCTTRPQSGRRRTRRDRRKGKGSFMDQRPDRTGSTITSTRKEGAGSAQAVQSFPQLTLAGRG